jgi:hypothetical protein
MKRNLFRRHDFVAHLKRLQQYKTQDGICVLAVMFILCHMNTFLGAERWLLRCISSCLIWQQSHDIQVANVDLTPDISNYIGGGGTVGFAYIELEPYLIDQIQSNCIRFNFVEYIEAGGSIGADQSHTSQVICDMPLEHLLPKLTVPELQMIAACHGLSFPGRTRKADIQAAINDHECESCKKYLSVFVGEYNDSKSNILNAVKRYQDKKGAQYKATNLAAVLKHQNKLGDQYKEYNLAAVQKHQNKQGDQYKESHLAAVLKNQEKQGDQYKESNLAAVQKHQNKQGDQYKESNLAAVLKNQGKQGDQYKESHLAAVLKNQEKQGDQYKSKNLDAVIKYQEKKGETYKKANLISARNYQAKKRKPVFPPSAPTLDLQLDIIAGACKDMSPNQITEAGCAVCGRLTPVINLTMLTDTSLNLNILERPCTTQKERFDVFDPMTCIPGPVLEEGLDSICNVCMKSISKGKVPKLSLANGLWIGKVPPQLLDLSYAEQLLIARVCHNRCIVRVSSGMHKMRANAISFENPMPKVYDILPPPIDELDEILAFIYTGPCKPTKAHFERTPFLVRRNKVGAALNWLKLNHSGYYDMEISYRNLNEYPEDGPPVVVDYHQSFINKDPESTAVNDNEEEEGTESGKCPFVVHGLTGEEYSNMSLKAMKAVALKHLTTNGLMLAIGHSAEPLSIYNNPEMFPQMMPWLFPYGYGGFGNVFQEERISELAHKRHLLMYHDKRFQKDPHFPLIAFNHEQIKQCTTAGYLLLEKSKFEDISQRLFDVDIPTLKGLAKRMEDGDRVTPDTDEEKLCFQILKDLDHVGGHVKGSLTSKKYMRNEIWSLVSFLGAPSWFITFSPADVKHPIALYFADIQETFKPEIRCSDERYRLIAHNPVAGARFFHFMCQIFIKHVLGVGTKHRGLYGDTAAYYGTVEQQGRLTLHLHLLLWIMASLSPQEIRDRIMDPNSDFQRKMVEYLESVHAGEFLTGNMDDVKAEIQNKSTNDEQYIDPTQTLPEMPPNVCDDPAEECFVKCQCVDNWWVRFKHTVDDLLF